MLFTTFAICQQNMFRLSFLFETARFCGLVIASANPRPRPSRDEGKLELGSLQLFSEVKSSHWAFRDPGVFGAVSILRAQFCCNLLALCFVWMSLDR